MKVVGRFYLFCLVALLGLSSTLLADKGTASNRNINWADGNDTEFFWYEPGGTQLSPTTPASDDVYETIFSSGFTFNFYGTDFDRIYVGTNGFATFANTSQTFNSNDNLSASQTPDSLLAIFWDDLDQPGGFPPSRIFSQMIGIAPYRRYIISWDNMRIASGPGGSDGPLRCQVILYETSNVIKYQYFELAGGGAPNSFEQGGSASVGLRFPGDSQAYSVNSTSLSDLLPIFFYPEDQISGAAAFNAASDTVQTGGINQTLSMNISGVSFNDGNSIVEMGKADVVRIRSPFGGDVDTMTVSEVWVDGTSFFLDGNNSQPPTAEQTAFIGNIATWHFDDPQDSLYIQLPPFSIRDSIRIVFQTNIPSGITAPSNRDFDTNVFARLNGSSNGFSASPTVRVTAADVSRFEISPAADSTIAAGANLQFNITAFDEFNNTVSSDDSVNIIIIGSSTVIAPSGERFGNSSSLSFTVSDSVAGEFSVRVENVQHPEVTISSGIITVQPGAADALEMVTGDGETVTAGANQILQVRVSDGFGNLVPNTDVRFQVTGGGGNIGGSNQVDITSDAEGLAEVTLTTGPTAGVTNTVLATLLSGSMDTFTFNVNTTPGQISYFTVVPSAFNFTAGQTFNVTVTAFDANDNQVSETGTSVDFASFGGASVSFPGGTSGTLTNGATTFSVSNTEAEVFRVTAALTANAAVQGVSDEITIAPAAASTISINNGDGQTGAVSTQLPLPLEVQVADAFGNLINGATVTFDPVGGGSVTNPTDLTDANGIATTDWTVHATPTNDSVKAFIAGVGTTPDTLTFNATVVAGAGDTLIRVAPAVTSGTVDTDLGDVFEVQVTDNVGNPVAGFDVSFAIVIAPDGSTNESLSVTSTTTNASGSASTLLHLGTRAGSYTVRAYTNATNPSFVDFVATANPGVADSLVHIVGDGETVTAGQNLQLQARVIDAFGNELSGEGVRFQVTAGGGNIGGGSVFITTSDADGLVSATLTTGTTSGVTNTVVATSLSGSNDTQDYNISTTSGQISYFTLIPEAFTLTAGDTFDVTVTAFDANDNQVSETGTLLDFDDFGGASVVYPNGNTGTLTNGVAVYQAFNVDAEIFRLTASLNANPAIQGVTDPITTVAAAPSVFSIVSGDGQTGAISTQLPLPLQVRVTDEFGNNVSGATVTFDPVGGGAVSNPTDVTGNDGIATTDWTVHNTTDNDSLKAYITGVTTTPDTLTFNATVTSGTGDNLTQTPPGITSGVVDTDLGGTFEVRVTDSGGNPVEGLSISFAIVDKPAGSENETLSAFSVATDASGFASTILHLGTIAGSYTVRAFSAITTPGFVDFVATATPGAADSILIVSGNNQSGIVGQALSDSVKYQVVDIFGNGVSGITVDFASASGSVNPVSDVSDNSGHVATAWTLGTTTGLVTLNASASSPTLSSTAVTASAQPGTVDRLNLVFMRDNTINRDSIAVIAGENVLLVVEALDINGNPIPGVTLSFESQPGFNLEFFNSAPITNEIGRVSNVVTTDATQDSSFFRVFNGAVELELHTYSINYAGNLTPMVVSPGQTNIAFSMDVNNFSTQSVDLDLANTNFTFNDGITSYSASLASPATLLPGNNNLTFSATTLSNSFAPGNYAPTFVVKGENENSSLSGVIQLPGSELSVFSVQINSISGASSVPKGDTLRALMSVQNSAGAIIDINSLATTLDVTGSPAVTVIPDPANATQIPAEGLVVLAFDIIVPGNATNSYTVGGVFNGTVNGTAVPATATLSNAFTFNVTDNAFLTVQNFQPLLATTGEAAAFTSDIFNDGGLPVVLDTVNTYITFGTNDTLRLKQTYAVPTGGAANAVEVEWEAAAILSLAGDYGMSVRLNGTQNGTPFDTTVVSLGTLTVQDPPNVVVQSINVLPLTVSQNQSGIVAEVVLVNSGANNADAVLELPAGVTLFGTQTELDSLAPIGGSQTITLSADAASSVIQFNFSVSDTFPAGTETMGVRYRYSDANTGRVFPVTAPDQDTFDVLTRALLSLSNVSITPDTAYAGVTNSGTLSFTVQNQGQSAASIAASDIAIDFNNDFSPALQSPAALPIVLGQGASQTFQYLLTIPPSVGIGPDPFDLTFSHTDTLSNVSYTDIDSTNIDTLLVLQGAGDSDLIVQSVVVDPELVNQGNTGINATVVLENRSVNPVAVDTVRLVGDTLALGGSFITALSPAQVISGGDTAQFEYTFSVNPATEPGILILDGEFVARDIGSGVVLRDSGAVSVGELTVLKPAAINFSPVTITPDTASEGQTGIIVATEITNGDSVTSDLMLTNLGVQFSPNDGSVSAVLETPTTLPTLPGGQSVNIRYRLTVADPAASNSISARFGAVGTDVTDGASVSDSSLTDTLTIVPKASLAIVAIDIPVDSVVVGDNEIPVAITVENTGVGTAQLNSVSLDLVNGPELLKSLQTFTLPDTLISGQQSIVNYTIDVPDNLVLTGGFRDVFASASLSGEDVVSGIAIFNTADSLDTLVIVDSVQVVNGLDPVILPAGPFSINQSESFQVTLGNNGGAVLQLDGNTRLRLERTNAPGSLTPISINMAAAATDSILSPGENQNILEFQPSVLAESGDFRLIVELSGTVFGQSYQQDYDTEQFISVGQQVAVTAINVIPGVVGPGQANVGLEVVYGNLGGPVAIDPGTILNFRYTEGDIPLSVENLLRTDTLTMIPSGGDTMSWAFDIPSDANAGEVNIVVSQNFESGAFNVTSQPQTFDISSGVSLAYVDGSLTPNPVVPGQAIQFSAQFINLGSSTYILNTDSTFIRFSDTQPREFSAALNGSYSIGGIQNAMVDTSTIFFTTTVLDDSFDIGAFDVDFEFSGTQQNGDRVDTLLDNSTQITTISPANVVLDSVNIVPALLVPGQQNITVHYYLRNSGDADAALDVVNSVFEDAGGDVGAFWTQQSQSAALPQTILSGEMLTFSRDFILSENSATGEVFARAALTYSDAANSYTFDQPAPRDSAEIIQPSRLFIESLTLSNVPNALAGTVNFNQPLQVTLVLQNNGGDPVDGLILQLINDATGDTVDTLTPLSVIQPDDMLTIAFDDTAGTLLETREYRAVITQALSQTSGDAVEIGAPLDDEEDVTIQEPRELNVFSSATGGGIYSQAQEFQVNFTVKDTVGNSPYGNGEVSIELPAGFSLVPPSIQTIPFDINDLTGGWTIMGDNVSQGALDTLRVRFSQIPTDLNIDSLVQIGADSIAEVTVRIDSSARVLSTLAILSPVGAQDSIVSTGQTFIISDTVFFDGGFNADGRTAEIVVPPGFAVNTPTTVTLPGDTSRSAVSWEVTVPTTVPSTQPAVFTFNHEGTETNTGLPVTRISSLPISVVSQARLALTADIIAPTGATDGILSTEQFLDLRLSIDNLGAAVTTPLDSSDVLISLPLGFTSPENLQRRIATNETDVIRIRAPQTAQGPNVISATFTNVATDVNSNLGAAVVDSTDQIENINIVDRANLSVSIAAGNLFALSQSNIPVNVTVENTGDALVNPAEIGVELTLDNGFFTFSGGQSGDKDTLYLPIVDNAAQGTFQVNATGQAGFSNFITTLIPANSSGQISQDANNNYPDTLAFISDSTATHPVEIREGGGIVIDSIRAVVDNALVDDTLSNGQDFTLRAYIKYDGNVALNGRTAKVSLPAGFFTETDSVEQVITGDDVTVDWPVSISEAVLSEIISKGSGGKATGNQTSASNDSSSSRAENGDLGEKIEAVLQEFYLQVKAQGRNAVDTSQVVSLTQQDTILVESRAEMRVRTEIAGSTGALQGTISTGLPFDIRIWVERLGDAGLFDGDSNFVSLHVPDGYRILGAGVAPGDTVLPVLKFDVGFSNAKVVSVVAPDAIPGVPQSQVFARLDSTARDENTAQNAYIIPNQGTSPVPLTLEERATLRLDDLQANAPSFGINQGFSITGVLTNIGDAAVAPDDSVSVELSFDTTKFVLENGETARKRIQLQGKQDTPINWDLMTRSDLGDFEIIATILDSLSYDEHGPDSIPVFTAKGADSTMISIAEVGTVALTSAQIFNHLTGDDSVTVSTEQVVRVALKASISGEFENRLASLELPDIFTTQVLTDTISTVTDSVEWLIQVPDTVTNLWEMLKVRIQATSSINQAITLRDSLELFIFVEDRARLSISGEITDGAFNNTVSQGNSFTYQAVVQNTGTAGLQTSPVGEIALSFGNGLQLAAGDTLEKNFAINQPVSWTIDASENSAMKAVIGRINDLKSNKMVPVDPESAARTNREFQSKLSSLYKELNTLAEESFVRANVSRRPVDINSGRPVAFAVGCGCDTLALTIAEAPFITVESFTVPAVISTDQVVEFRLEVDAPPNVVDRRAEIIELPSGLEATLEQAFNQDSVVTWTVLGTAASSGNIRVQVEGRDLNSSVTNPVFVQTEANASITVQNKALLRLRAGSEVLNAQRGDTLTIQATVSNVGEAEVTGQGSLRLDLGVGDAFTLLDPDTVKTFSLDGGLTSASVSWEVVAPQVNVNNTIFEVTYEQRPLDVNTNALATLENTRAIVSVNMVASELRVLQLSEVMPEESYVQGQTNVAILGLEFSNENTNDGILLKEFILDVIDGQSGEAVTDIENLLSRIEVVGYNFHLTGSGSPGVLGGVNISGPTSGPLSLIISPADTIPPETLQQVVVRLNLADQNINRNFSLRINRIVAEGEFAGNIAEVKDNNNVPIEQSPIFTSLSITILSSDVDQIFRNYPNPFGMDTQIPGGNPGETRFSFFMENEGDAQLSIYTLLGRLVFQTDATGLARGLHNRTLTWSGLNGDGRRVVNGVYVAVLKIGYNNGSNKTLQTKVAYIK